MQMILVQEIQTKCCNVQLDIILWKTKSSHTDINSMYPEFYTLNGYTLNNSSWLTCKLRAGLFVLNHLKKIN